MLLSSGARFGLRRTAAHLIGVTTGYLGIVLIAYAGVGAMIVAYPSLQTVLTILCVTYLAWLGYQLLREGWSADANRASVSGSDTDGESGIAASQPQTWLQATLFQLVNPKGWGAAVAATGIVNNDGLAPATGALLLLSVTTVVNPLCTGTWALFGAGLRPYLRVRWVHVAFNVSMAALILLTAWWMARPLM
jgi:threonine/homoserine/homoserine lactone efflux protein